MDRDELNAKVTGAIWRAQQLENQHAGTQQAAWAEVSSLEEKLAKEVPLSEPEGRVARRGAVRAALKAGDPHRARALAERFSEEDGHSGEIRRELREMLDEHSLAHSAAAPAGRT